LELEGPLGLVERNQRPLVVGHNQHQGRRLGEEERKGVLIHPTVEVAVL
jgi:hypothetical protein